MSSTDGAKQLVNIPELEKQFADPTNVKISEVYALSKDDPKTADGKPIYNGQYNSEILFGEKMGHAKVIEKMVLESRIRRSLVSTRLLDPRARAEYDKLDDELFESLRGAIRARLQDLENGAIGKVDEILKPFGIQASRKARPGTDGGEMTTFDFADTCRRLMAKGGTLKDCSLVARAYRSHRVVKTKKNDGVSHDDICRSMQRSLSLFESPVDGC